MISDALEVSISDARSSPGTEIIDLRRVAPPKVASLGEELQSTLHDLHRTADLSELVRHNRFTGTVEDRAMGAQWVGRRLGAAPPPERMIVTNGTQNALLLVIRTLLAPNDLLLAEAMTYPQLRAVSELSGIRLKGVLIDQDGLIPAAFEEICRETRPKALYCVPTIHNPTTAVLPSARREAIVEIACQYGVTILEDDARAARGRAGRDSFVAGLTTLADEGRGGGKHPTRKARPRDASTSRKAALRAPLRAAPFREGGSGHFLAFIPQSTAPSANTLRSPIIRPIPLVYAQPTLQAGNKPS